MTRRYSNGPLAGCSFVLASDVRNPLYGRKELPYFAPQRATPEWWKKLDRRARQFAEESARRMGKDTSSRPGAGAAGGLGYAFLQYLQATTQSGADLLLDLSGFDRLLADTDLVITGEGHADRQTLMGKLPERVMRRAQAKLVPTWLVAGKASDTQALLNAGSAGGQSCTGQHASGRSHPSGSHPGKYPPVGRIRMESAEKVVPLSRNTYQNRKNMKAYPLLYLSLFSFVTILACKPPRTTQAKKMKEMEKKELKMLEDSQPKSEEEAIENYFGPSHDG